MSKHCTTVEQGYPTLRTMHDCALTHTGFDLWPMLAFGLTLLVVGAVFVVAAGRWAK